MKPSAAGSATAAVGQVCASEGRAATAAAGSGAFGASGEQAARMASDAAANSRRDQSLDGFVDIFSPLSAPALGPVDGADHRWNGRYSQGRRGSDPGSVKSRFRVWYAASVLHFANELQFGGDRR